MFKKVISFVLSVIFSLQTCGLAQAGQLNLSGYLGQGGGVPALDRFHPAHLRYFSYEPDSDNFRILLDKADEKDLSDVQVKDKADELMRYFRIGLSLPNDKFWVNLRPDAPEQIIDPALEQTDMGKIMLEADLQLKKDTSSLTSPQTKEGKEYWDKLYKNAGELFGTENITIPTITRPWIVPGEIIVRESGNSAYIYKAALKVMLEEDYLKSSQLSAVSSQQYNFTDPRLKELNQYSTQLIRELIIPKLTKEVNRAKRYAGLRQVYYSLILARWFKQSYQNSGASEHQGIRAPVNENNTLAKLIDSGSLTNLTSQEPWSKDTYYQGYKKSFEQGEYNLSETVRTPTGQLIRRYMSGGTEFTSSALTVKDRYKTVTGRIINGPEENLLNYSGGNPVAIASGSSLIEDKEISERLKGWPIFESIEKSIINPDPSAITSFPTNILIGKTVCTTIQVLMAWAEVDGHPENLIKYWIVEFKENAKSKEPVARIKVYGDEDGSFSAETPKNLSDTERKLIVAKMLSKPLFLDKTQMEEIAQVSSALTSEQKENEDLVGAIEYVAWKFSELTAIGNISLYASGGMIGLGVNALSNYEDFRSGLKEINKRISEYKKQDSWSIELKKDSTFEQIKNRLLEEAGITSSSALTRVTSKGDWFIDNILKTAKNVKKNLTPEEGKKLEGILDNMEKIDFLDHVYAFLDSINSGNKTIPVPMNLLFTALIELGFFDKIAEKKSELMKSDLNGDADNVTYKLDGEGIELLNYKLQYVNISVKSEDRDKKFLLKFYHFYPGVLLDVDKYVELEFEFFVSSEDGKVYKIKLDHCGKNFEKAFMAAPYKELRGLPHKFMEALELGASSALVTKGAAPEDIGAVDFRAMDMLIQPVGSFSGLDFSPVRLSSSALEAMDLDKSLEGIKQMVSGSMRPAPQRLKEYISACIFKGKIDEKADDFILSMLEVFQLQAEEGIESAAQEREAVVLADTRRYVLPEKRLAASNGYGLN